MDIRQQSEFWKYVKIVLYNVYKSSLVDHKTKYLLWKYVKIALYIVEQGVQCSI